MDRGGRQFELVEVRFCHFCLHSTPACRTITGIRNSLAFSPGISVYRHKLPGTAHSPDIVHHARAEGE